MTVVKQPELLTATVLTEAALQYAAAYWAVRRRRHTAVVPNTNVFGWESDLVTVTDAGLAHEFEIKTSRADWRAEQRRVDADGLIDAKARRRRHLAGDPDPAMAYRRDPGPAYFWLVAAEDVIPDDEVWACAGVMRPEFWAGRWWVVCGRRAPRLHGEHVSDRTLRWMMRGMALRMYGQSR